MIYLAQVNKRLEIASISADDDADGSAESSRDERAQAAQAAREADRELVARAKAGDPEAFRELFDRYNRRAYSLAYGMLRNADDALDVVQEGFIKAHRYLDKFEGNSSFYTWLYRIVSNLAIDHIRKAKRARNVDFDGALDQRAADAADDTSLSPTLLGSNPQKALARREIREQIDDALGQLSDNHRAVLVMRELEGMTYEEMAQAMDCSKGTIMSRLFHARKNMQKLLLEMRGERDLDA